MDPAANYKKRMRVNWLIFFLGNRKISNFVKQKRFKFTPEVLNNNFNNFKNIRLGWKWPTVANIGAYNDMELNYDRKSFIILAPGNDPINKVSSKFISAF
jgi:hypothetical protein